MARVVMLTALAGEGIDIVVGDLCECSQEQAIRFVAVGYAREPDQPGDEQRTLKRLPCADAEEGPIEEPLGPNGGPTNQPNSDGKSDEAKPTRDEAKPTRDEAKPTRDEAKPTRDEAKPTRKEAKPTRKPRQDK